MAEFCSDCSPFDEFDINLFTIALDLKPGHSETILCEGCNIKAVYKDEEGLVYLAKEVPEGVELEEAEIDTLMK